MATTLGAEGLDVRPGENILLADSDEGLRDAILAVARDPDRRTKLIEAGRVLVVGRYDWSRQGAKLFENYQSLLSESRSV